MSNSGDIKETIFGTRDEAFDYFDRLPPEIRRLFYYGELNWTLMEFIFRHSKSTYSKLRNNIELSDRVAYYEAIADATSFEAAGKLILDLHGQKALDAILDYREPWRQEERRAERRAAALKGRLKRLAEIEPLRHLDERQAELEIEGSTYAER